MKVGYKDILNLDAIIARFDIKTCALNIDGSTKPPQAEMSGDLKTPGVSMWAPEYPLPYLWYVSYSVPYEFNLFEDDVTVPKPDSPRHLPRTRGHPLQQTVPSHTRLNSMTMKLALPSFASSTRRKLCRYFNWLTWKLKLNSSYHLFKLGIKPMWEDEANANGGKWIWIMKSTPGLLDRCWNRLAMALVSEEFEEGDEFAEWSPVSGARSAWRSSITLGRSSSSCSTRLGTRRD